MVERRVIGSEYQKNACINYEGCLIFQNLIILLIFQKEARISFIMVDLHLLVERVCVRQCQCMDCFLTFA